MLVEGSASFLIMHETKPVPLSVLHCRCARITTSFVLESSFLMRKSRLFDVACLPSRPRILILPVKRTMPWFRCVLSRRRTCNLIGVALFSTHDAANNMDCSVERKKPGISSLYLLSRSRLNLFELRINIVV